MQMTIKNYKEEPKKLENSLAKLKAAIWAMKQNESCKRKMVIQKVE